MTETLYEAYVKQKMHAELKEKIKKSILTLGFRSTVERLVMGGADEQDAIKIVNGIHAELEASVGISPPMLSWGE